ncbi:MAG: ethanolamine utilization protein EutJ [Anaerolineales bacterium]|nr:ethanolamine utilization protein EutJ [Anaerolineales bacterium]
MARAAEVLRRIDQPEPPPLRTFPKGKLLTGVDLGTAYLVLVVLDEQGVPLAGEYQFAQVVRDGLVVDYVGAVDRLSAMKTRVEARLGRELDEAASSFPPGVPRAEVRATANVVEAAGLRCDQLVDEPSAANALLGLQNGAIVDVGGGTTGIAIIEDGRVVYTADEATGGTHFSLVIAGALDLSFEEAEETKKDPAQQARLLPVVRPVMEKVAGITARHLEAYQAQGGRVVEQITLVGGTSAFAGMAGVVQNFTGLATEVPDWPMFVTPLGIALCNRPGEGTE